MVDGYQLAKNVIDYLKFSAGKRKLTESNDYGLWHARINGLFAEAGARNNLGIEVSRKFRHPDFLNRYFALYNKRVEIWRDRPPSTEIDVIYLNPIDCSVVALCEYENEDDFNGIADNIVKFHALASSSGGDYQPVLCIISFFWEEQDRTVGNTMLDKLENIIKTTTRAEKILFKDKNYEFSPMKSWWLLIPFYETRRQNYWRYSIINPQGKRVEEKEFSLNTKSQA